MKRKIRSFRHPLAMYSKEFIAEKSDKEIREMAEAYSKTGEGAESLNDALLIFTLSVAGSFYHHNKDELFSVALERAWYAIKKWPEANKGREDYNIKAYIAGWIRKGLQGFVAGSRDIPAPSGAKSDKKTVTFTELDTSLEPASWDETVGHVEVKELIDSLNPTDQERTLIALAYAGNNKTQISRITGISLPTVSRRMIALADRLATVIQQRGDSD